MPDALTDIQRALETVRLASVKADWQRKLDILLLMMSTSQSVVANARKLTEPERKQVKQTVVVPKTQVVKRYVNMPSNATQTANDTRQPQQRTDTTAAKEPLTNSQYFL